MIANDDVSLRLSKVKRPSIRSKAGAVVGAIQQISEKFQDLLTEILILEDESNTYKDELLKQKEKCESKTCSGSEGLKSIIELAASTALRLNETKNLSIISDLLKVLCGEVLILTTSKYSEKNKENETVTTPLKSPKKKSKVKKNLSPKKDLNKSAEDISFNEESISEIDVTPGRTSPILSLKTLKSYSSVNTLYGNTVDSRDKKKCPSSWPTSEKKMVKLCSPKGITGGKGRSRQCRLTTYLAKPPHVVDLTHSPVGSAGADSLHNPQPKLLLKQESSDIDDTILPSQTSSAINITSKQHSKENVKPKKSPLSLKKESSDSTKEPAILVIPVVDNKVKDNARSTKSPFKVKIEQSPCKKQTNNKLELESFETPKKTITIGPNDKTPDIVEENGVLLGIAVKQEMLHDITCCNDVSVSILKHVEGMDAPKTMEVDGQAQNSECKRPLEENRKLLNMPELENSMSILNTEPVKKIEYKHKRKYMQGPEPVFKEPTVRKKAEKMALPGWCCQECVDFFGDLYEDDPDKISKIVSRCSKHRGRNNPARPPTPPGFWYPRWDVPSCTAEFNARNDAL